MGPVVVEIDWSRQLGFVQADNVTFTLVNELTNCMLLLSTVKASDIEAHHSEFLQLCHFAVVSSRPIVLLVRLLITTRVWCVRFLLSTTLLFW